MIAGRLLVRHAGRVPVGTGPAPVAFGGAASALLGRSSKRHRESRELAWLLIQGCQAERAPQPERPPPKTPQHDRGARDYHTRKDDPFVLHRTMMLARERAYYAARTMRALELLVFGEHSGPELAETLGIHRRTARRLLSELAADDYLTQDRHRRLRATRRLAALGRQAVAQHPFPRLAARGSPSWPPKPP
jgi:hypothetical protein